MIPAGSQPYPFAILVNGTSLALRFTRGAEVLAKGYYVGIDVQPMLFGEFGPQCHFAFQGGGGLDVSPTVTDAVDVDIHADGGEGKSYSPHQIGGFASHPGEGEHIVNFRRNPTSEIPVQDFRQFLEVLGFGIVKSHWIDQGADLFHA